MFYADILGIAGLAGTAFGKIDTLPKLLVFIVCFIWLIARLVFYIIRNTQAVRREAFDQRKRELNGHHKSL